MYTYVANSEHLREIWRNNSDDILVLAANYSDSWDTE